MGKFNVVYLHEQQDRLQILRSIVSTFNHGRQMILYQYDGLNRKPGLIPDYGSPFVDTHLKFVFKFIRIQELYLYHVFNDYTCSVPNYSPKYIMLPKPGSIPYKFFIKELKRLISQTKRNITLCQKYLDKRNERIHKLLNEKEQDYERME